MASANGNRVSHWWANVNAWVASETDTQATVTVECRFQSDPWGYNVWAGNSAYVGCDGQSAGGGYGTIDVGYGVAANVLAVSHTFTVNKSSSGRNVWCTATFTLGGYEPGTSTAGVNVWINSISYKQPRPPKDFAVSRASDSKAELTWAADYTGMDGLYPWSGIYVDRRTDDGEWTNVATLTWSALNWSDNGISANHKYEYRLASYGPGGMSQYATADAIYTTPAAPKAVTLAKVTDTTVSVGIEGAAPYATSYDVQCSLNGGGWQAAGSTSTWPYEHDPGGGTAQYRVRAVRGTLASAWTESVTIATITPPLAPYVSSSNAVAPTGSVQSVMWTPNHPDGSAQSQAQVEYTVTPQGGAAGSPTTVDIQGGATSWTIPSSVMDEPCTVSVRVRTHGLDPDWGAWSGPAQIRVAVPPDAYFTNPGIDGAHVGGTPLTVSWVARDDTGIASQQVSLLDASGATLWSASPAPGDDSVVLGPDTYQLSNGTPYSLRLTVRGGSTLAVTSTRSFATAFVEPSKPGAELAVGESDMSVAVTAVAGPSSTDEGNPVWVDATPGQLLPGAVVYGNTRQNLWVNPSGSEGGATVTMNDDGTVTLSGTPTSNMYFANGSIENYVLKPGGTYTLSIDKALPTGCAVMATPTKDGAAVDGSISINGALRSTGTLPDDFDYVMYRFYFVANQALSGTYRIMLNEGSEAQPWCPPGIHGVEDLTLVTAGKNLTGASEFEAYWASQTAGVRDGMLAALNLLDAGTYTISADFKLLSKTASFDGATDSYGFAFGVAYGDYVLLDNMRKWGVGAQVGDVKHYEATFEVDSDEAGRMGVFYSYGAGSAKSAQTGIASVTNVQIERGTQATAYEPPNITKTTIGLQGNSLHSLPDGTRDELHVDSSGACSIDQAVGYVASYSNQAIGSDFIASAYTADGQPAQGATVIWPLDAVQTVELGGIDMPALPYARSQAFVSSDIPTTMRVTYPATSTMDVARILPDGTQWTVASGLLPAQQAIDPLPPLNLGFHYRVTAHSPSGTSSEALVPAFVESNAAAFNFGPAAGECELLRLDPSWSRSPSIATELYDFADGGRPAACRWPTPPTRSR